MITGIDAHYFLAKDLARALTFYREALQLEAESPVCHTLWCTDTEGNTFALHRRKE